MTDKTLEVLLKPSRSRHPAPAPGYQRQLKDRWARWLMKLVTVLTVSLVPCILVALYLRARPLLATQPIMVLLLSDTWRPLQGAFGFFPFIMGTMWVTISGMLIAIPLSLFTAIYLAEYARPRVRSIIMPFIDLLAGIPSVVYGVWGMLTVVPWIQQYLAPAVNKYLGFIPIFRLNNPTGFSVVAGGIVLAVMVFPIIIAVAIDVIRSVPQGLREASLALGATRWQMIKQVVLRRAWPGVMAAIVLGFSRAFGETMAVLMVVGNVPKAPESIFDPAYPLTALIANNYGEMMSIPLYDAALLCGALILLLIVLIFNLFSQLILTKLVHKE